MARRSPPSPVRAALPPGGVARAHEELISCALGDGREHFPDCAGRARAAVSLPAGGNHHCGAQSPGLAAPGPPSSTGTSGGPSRDGQLIEDGAKGDALQGSIDHEGEGALVVVLAEWPGVPPCPVEPGHGNKELVLEIHGAMIGRQPRPRLYAAPLGEAKVKISHDL